ncbi:hypothetical protein HH310_19355 [Actinoplanes sp. TBRC 11911]|uniref:hypothetical protein n=1 Tax=Actinoplanes sp. TBRC 11911 TaxID=2729386 RepID=UPI00145CEE93|nr:hypothetical protein [Actinoplanes sp. TBRC 11911]NMO53337.1 hypothetical protein [Actinoplanes sp. TBRC 11911]
MLIASGTGADGQFAERPAIIGSTGDGFFHRPGHGGILSTAPRVDVDEAEWLLRDASNGTEPPPHL